MYTWYERLQDWRRRSLSSWDGTGVVRSFGGAATTISRKTLFAALACFCTVALFVSRRSLSESLPHELSKAEAAGKVESASDKEGGDLGSPCALRLRTCFSESFLDVRSSTPATSTTETFRRIAFEHPRCGDCLIVHLLAKTGNVGLEVFLPSKATEEVTREDELAIERIGVHGKDWERVEYKHWTGSDASIRSRAITLIQRYSYTLATSRIAFQSIRNGGEGLSTMLNSLSTPSDRLAFWALNDDMLSDAPIEAVEDVDRRSLVGEK